MIKTREFFDWGFSDDESLAVIEDYEDDTFDVRSIWRATPIDEHFPSGMKYLIGPERLPDYVNSQGIGPIVSERLVQALLPLIQKDCQIVPRVPIFLEKTGKPVTGYCLLNPLRAISISPDRRKKNFKGLLDIMVDPTRVPEDLHIFRPKEDMVSIIVSEEFVRTFKKNKLLGGDFYLLKSSSGLSSKKSK